MRDLINRYDPGTPLEEASTIPAAWYRNAELADLELRTAFSTSWQVAARMEQVRQRGSYVASTIAGEPVLIVRGSDGLLRAFFNVCRHHAAAVMTEPSGIVEQLRCPYHAWTYSLEGKLTSAPDLGAICNFDRNDMGLLPIELAAWKDWIFVRLKPGAPPLDDTPELSLNGLQWFERRHYRLNCNWKVFVDNYLDGGYHVPHLHKDLDAVLNYSEYQIELGDRSCLQWSPIEGEVEPCTTGSIPIS